MRGANSGYCRYQFNLSRKTSKSTTTATTRRGRIPPLAHQTIIRRQKNWEKTASGKGKGEKTNGAGLHPAP